MLLKSLLTKFHNPWIWGSSLIFFFGASAWGVEQGFIAPRIKKEKDWNLESKRLEQRTRGILPQFPDLETLHRQLKLQQSELDHLQKEVTALDGKVLRTPALMGLLKEEKAEEGALTVNRMGTEEGRCRIKSYLCDKFEIQGQRKFGALVKYLDSLEGSSSLLEILELELTARGRGAEPLEIKIRAEATHSPEEAPSLQHQAV